VWRSGGFAGVIGPRGKRGGNGLARRHGKAEAFLCRQPCAGRVRRVHFMPRRPGPAPSLVCGQRQTAAPRAPAVLRFLKLPRLQRALLCAEQTNKQMRTSRQRRNLSHRDHRRKCRRQTGRRSGFGKPFGFRPPNCSEWYSQDDNWNLQSHPAFFKILNAYCVEFIQTNFSSQHGWISHCSWTRVKDYSELDKIHILLRTDHNTDHNGWTLVYTSLISPNCIHKMWRYWWNCTTSTNRQHGGQPALGT